MRISEIIGRRIEKKATADLKKKAKMTQKLADTAQECVQNYAPKQPQQQAAPAQPARPNQSIIQPTAVKQQNRVGNLVKQIAASSNRPQPPTEMEKVLAFRKYCQLKTQTDQNYIARLRQLLAQAEASTK